MLQRQVNQQSNPGIPGMFVSSSPRAFALAGPGGLVVSSSVQTGIKAGNWCWFEDSHQDPNGAPTGVIDRSPTPDDYTPPIGLFLVEGHVGSFLYPEDVASMHCPPGRAIEIATAAEVWLRHVGNAAVVPGQIAWVRSKDGATAFSDAGTPPTGNPPLAPELWIPMDRWVARSACEPGPYAQVKASNVDFL